MPDKKPDAGSRFVDFGDDVEKFWKIEGGKTSTSSKSKQLDKVAENAYPAKKKA